VRRLLNSRLRTLVKVLEDGKYKTADYLAGRCNISEKTVRVRLSELSELIREHGAEIVSKKGTGYQLIISNSERYNSYIYQNELLPSISEDRIDYIFNLLLNTSEYIKKDNLCELLFISSKTLTTELKKVKYILSQYNLKLTHKPSYGMKVIGMEFDKRRCILDYLAVHHNYVVGNKEKQEIDKSKIGQFIIESINKFNLDLSELSFMNLTDYMYVTLERVRNGFTIEKPEEKVKLTPDSMEMKFATDLMEKMIHNFRITITDAETFYVAVQIAGKRMIGHSQFGENNFIISEKMDQLVFDMLEVVNETFKIDFRDNFNLRMLLNQHMLPFDIRMKYGIYLDNPLLEEIKKKYFFAYTMAQQACIPLQQHYGKEVTEEEISYFACLLAVGLEQQEKPVDKKNILLVCVSGKASSQLLLYKFRKEFEDYIDQLFVCNTFELASFNFDKVDYLFTTVPIHKKVPVPIMEINHFLEREEIIAVKEKFQIGDLEFLKDYYKESYFFTDINGKTKEEVLKEMCVRISERRDLPATFFESILEREGLGSTDYGNLAAIPHPNEIMIDENLVCVGILKKPILWSRNQVQLVILVSISDSKNKNTQKFFELTTNMLLNSDAITDIIKTKSFEVLINKLRVTTP
jgi:lichenan operon transcriptional antiterminator